MFRNKTWRLLLLALVVFGVLTALLPFSDIDNDGSLDSLVTEGLVLIPVLGAVTGLLFFLLTRLPAACLAAPQPVLTLLVPPPIPTR
jgi:hypothetical protein